MMCEVTYVLYLSPSINDVLHIDGNGMMILRFGIIFSYTSVQTL